MIRGTFLLRLFCGKSKNLSPFVGALSTIPVSKARLGLLNPVMSAQEKYLSSTRGIVELIWGMTGGGQESETGDN